MTAGGPVSGEPADDRWPARRDPQGGPPGGDPDAGPDRAADPLPPPEGDRAWDAEIKWWQRSGRAHFVVMARAEGERSRAIARSATLRWPPTRPDEIGDLTGAADELAERLLSAGWVAGEEGPAWYQRRFTWTTEQPLEGDVLQDDPETAGDLLHEDPRIAGTVPTAPVAPAATRPTRPARPARTAAWPAWTEELTRCQIEWRPGYRRSRFEVVLRTPGTRRGEVMGTSAPFKWTFMNPADGRDPEQVAAVSRLRAALLERGWEEVAPGRAWYARRFVWRQDAGPAAPL